MKRNKRLTTIILAFALTLSLIFTLGGCGNDDESGNDNNYTTELNSETDDITETIIIDLSEGEMAFYGHEPEMISLEVIRQGETLSFDFVGISLDRVFEHRDITYFKRVEITLADAEVPMDITEWILSNEGVFLAWSESGVPENPFRVFPKNATTGNLLMRYVTSIIVTR